MEVTLTIILFGRLQKTRLIWTSYGLPVWMGCISLTRRQEALPFLRTGSMDSNHGKIIAFILSFVQKVISFGWVHGAAVSSVLTGRLIHLPTTRTTTGIICSTIYLRISFLICIPFRILRYMPAPTTMDCWNGILLLIRFTR